MQLQLFCAAVAPGNRFFQASPGLLMDLSSMPDTLTPSSVSGPPLLDLNKGKTVSM
jgi:hypothetical protein